MRNFMIMIGALALVLAVSACGEATPEAPEKGPQTPATQTENTNENEGAETVATGDVYLLKVDGMT